VTTATAVALAPRSAKYGPTMPRAPSYVKSAKKLTTPMSTMKRNARARRPAAREAGAFRPMERSRQSLLVPDSWSSDNAARVDFHAASRAGALAPGPPGASIRWALPRVVGARLADDPTAEAVCSR
jgi:hypothetical protein